MSWPGQPVNGTNPGHQALGAPSRFNIHRQRNSPIPSRTGGIGNIRDDLASQRYQLTDPEGVYALPSSKGEKLYPDFFPWHKSKEEDTLAVEYVSRGFLQPPEVSNDTGSACASMLPLFKQWTSTPALSYFLVRSMQTREKFSRISTSSTFKPPPRVTLTDQKREAWLKDLASTSVPLRRLSRTIPHGIRNRALLEQCCAKEIPIPRAVWFARCVGANELRGLKRKGNASNPSSSTDLVWIRDWTEEVIDFFEKALNLSTDSVQKAWAEQSKSRSLDPFNTAAIVNIPEAKALQQKISYLTRLICNLFQESLLDRPLYLRWVISFLRKCRLEIVAAAFVFTKLYWQYIVQSPSLSQELAYALIERYSKLSEVKTRHAGNSTLADLMTSIETAMKDLFVVSPSSFVMPRLWRQVEPILSEALDSETPKISTLLESIRIRNESLAVRSSPSARVMKHGRPLILSRLDSIKNYNDFSPTSKSLHPSLRTNQSETLTTVFEWATTESRSGETVIYVAVALCEAWKEQSKELGISNAFIDFLVSIKDESSYSMDRVYCLVVELLRVDLFQLGDYFRRLVSLGILFVPRLRKQAEIQVKIINNIPKHYGEPNFTYQRKILLKRYLGNQELASNDTIESTDTTALGIVSTRLAFLFDDDDDNDNDNDNENQVNQRTPIVNQIEQDLSSDEVSTLKSLSRATKVELAENIATAVEEVVTKNIPLLLSQLAIIQRILVVLGDYRALYQCIWVTVPQTQNPSVLYFMACTAREYFTLFGALGQLTELVRLIIAQITKIQTKAKLTKDLFDLVQFFAKQLSSSDQDLKTDLEQLLKPQAGQSPQDITTLSPLSEVLLCDSNDFTLSSLGINEQTDVRSLPKHFAALSSQFFRACEGDGLDNTEIRSIVAGLKFLREIELSTFDELFTAWLRDQVAPALADKNAAFTRLLVFSVVYECVSLERIADIFMQLRGTGDRETTSQSYSWILQGLICPSLPYNALNLNVAESICFETQSELFKSANSVIYLRCLYDEIVLGSKPKDEQSSYSEFSLWCQNAKDFLLTIASSDPSLLMKTMVDPILELKNIGALKRLGGLVDYLLGSRSTSDSGDNLESELIKIIKQFNDFNMSLCQIQMKVMIASLKWSISSEENDDGVSTEKRVVSSILQAIKSCAAEARSLNVEPRVFGDIFLQLDPSIKLGILNESELLFLTSKDAPLVLVNGENIVPSLLEIIDACADAESDAQWHSSEFCQFMERLLMKCESQINNEKEDQVAIKSEDTVMEDVTTNEVHREHDTDKGAMGTGVLLVIKIAMISFQHGKNSSDTAINTEVLKGLVALNEICSGWLVPSIHGSLQDAINVIREGCLSVGDKTGPSNAGKEAQHPLVKDTQKSYLTDLMVYNRSTESFSKISVRAFDLLEDSNPTMSINDVPLDLALFDAAVERKNPR